MPRNPKSEAGYRIGIVNPLTLVGNEVQTILRERTFPYSKLVLLDAGGQSAGALTEVDAEPVVVAPVSQEGLDDLDLVFFCGPPATNREWIERNQADGFIAVDLSQPTSSGDGRLVVAGINLEEATGSDEILVSPHPVAIPVALILHQIQSVSPIDIATVTAVQPASEFGQEGVEQLAEQTMNVLNVQSMPESVFDRQLAFNLYPAAERNDDFIISQVRSLIHPKTEVALLVTQGTIFHSHTLSMFVKTRESRDRQKILDTLAHNPAFAFPEGDQEFGTIDAAGKDEVLIADVREDPAIEGGFWVWAVCDNLRRGSALNAVLIAEQALFGAGTTH